MNFEIIEIEDIEGDIQKHVVISNEDGSFKSFPAVEGNPEFDAFIAANPDALTSKKAGK